MRYKLHVLMFALTLLEEHSVFAMGVFFDMQEKDVSKVGVKTNIAASKGYDEETETVVIGDTTNGVATRKEEGGGSGAGIGEGGCGGGGGGKDGNVGSSAGNGSISRSTSVNLGNYSILQKLLSSWIRGRLALSN